ncbi:MAG: 4-(cytidine 5'-diphospho)-2-C-methyl-D-erythritol kinase [Chloroflexi bacterium]|nr:4-(cytidine 5'-diphospho)-2-C-methyl-D-erythritol kinase [Chloroflexota bacterium]MCL5075002.1 4-(cytidine 5'-diphospho)-2-C-methyl-D-erythritol kinase [Chloroflexota bacterium]
MTGESSHPAQKPMAAEGGKLILPAFAKINLSLEVLGKRPDGYHEIMSVMQTVELHDELSFRPAKEIILRCNLPSLNDEDNLVFKAARLLARCADIRNGVEIELVKRIPVAGGLGGGSSDAACTLIVLNRLWHLDYPLEKLQDLSAELGSDVAFFLQGGAALAEGRGERLSPLPAFPTTWVVLLTPHISLPDKTRFLYSCLTPANHTDGSTTLALSLALREGQPIPSTLFRNTFEPILRKKYRLIEDLHSKLRLPGVEVIGLSGSGPTLYALCASKSVANTIYERLLNLPETTVFLTRTISREEIRAKMGH